jgi:hypothetical protein
MPTPEESLELLRRTPTQIAAWIRGKADADLGKRPSEKAWAAKEVICHLRDVEEMFHARALLALHNDNPTWVPAVDADRWAADRQYLRNDAAEALAAFERRRADTLALFASLAPDQWERAGTHPTRGRMTLRELAAFEAWHDDNHLKQLERALRGEP